MAAARPHALINRREAIAGLAGATALAATGCTLRDPRTVRFWAVGREGEVAAELVKEFTRENPSIAVEVQKLPWSAAHEKLLTAYAGDTLPDLCQLGLTWVPEFAALNVLEPFNDRVQRSSALRTAGFFEGFLDANRIQGELYGLPWYIDTRLLFYRRDLLRQAGFDRPPATWAEWDEMLAGIKKVVGPDRYSVLLPLNEFEQLLIFALQQPIDLLREGRWGNFRDPHFKRALEYYKTMFERGWAPAQTNTQISNVHDEFGKGYFSFYVSGPWQIGEFKRRLPANLQDAWMTAPMPGPDGPGASIAGGASLVIFRTSRLKDEAWALAEFLSRPATQQRFYEITGDMPTRQSAWALPALANSPYARAFRAQIDRVRSPPKVPEWERIATEMRLAAERVVKGVQSIDEAVMALDRKTDEILEKRRWMLERKAVT